MPVIINLGSNKQPRIRSIQTAKAYGNVDKLLLVYQYYAVNDMSWLNTVSFTNTTHWFITNLCTTTL